MKQPEVKTELMAASLPSAQGLLCKQHNEESLEQSGGLDFKSSEVKKWASVRINQRVGCWHVLSYKRRYSFDQEAPEHNNTGANTGCY